MTTTATVEVVRGGRSKLLTGRLVTWCGGGYAEVDLADEPGQRRVVGRVVAEQTDAATEQPQC